MKLSFSVIRGTIGTRPYYSLLVPLSELPRLFRFTDWTGGPSVLHAQRVLNRARVLEIARYILENRNGYLLSSITAS